MCSKANRPSSLISPTYMTLFTSVIAVTLQDDLPISFWFVIIRPIAL